MERFIWDCVTVCLIWVHSPTNSLTKSNDFISCQRPLKILWMSFLTLYLVSPNVILQGDFNVHVDNTSDTLTTDFTPYLDSYGLHNFIYFPHTKGHTLHLVYRLCVTSLHWTSFGLSISDQKLESLYVNTYVSKTKPPPSISFCNIKIIDQTARSKWLDNLASKDNWCTPNELVFHYNNGLGIFWTV